jgi:hypothetical protein
MKWLQRKDGYMMLCYDYEIAGISVRVAFPGCL